MWKELTRAHRPVIVNSKLDTVHVSLQLPGIRIKHNDNLISLKDWEFIIDLLTIDSVETFYQPFFDVKPPMCKLIEMSLYLDTDFPMEYACFHSDYSNATSHLCYLIRQFGRDHGLSRKMITQICLFSDLSEKEVLDRLYVKKKLTCKNLQKYIVRKNEKRVEFWNKECFEPTCPICRIKIPRTTFPYEIDYLACCYQICHKLCLDKFLYRILDIQPPCTEHDPCITACLKTHIAIKYVYNPNPVDCIMCGTSYEHGVINTMFENLHTTLNRKKLRAKRPHVHDILYKHSAETDEHLYYWSVNFRENYFHRHRQRGATQFLAPFGENRCVPL